MHPPRTRICSSFCAVQRAKSPVFPQVWNPFRRSKDDPILVTVLARFRSKLTLLRVLFNGLARWVCKFWILKINLTICVNYLKKKKSFNLTLNFTKPQQIHRDSIVAEPPAKLSASSTKVRPFRSVFANGMENLARRFRVCVSFAHESAWRRPRTWHPRISPQSTAPLSCSMGLNQRVCQAEGSTKTTLSCRICGGVTGLPN